MKLIGISITNIRKIRAAELDFNGMNLVEVRGKNGAGKSTVIDSILFLFSGSRAIPSGVVTSGEARGVIVGTVGEYTVRRVISADDKTTLSVEGPEGKIAKPQDFLDSLAGQFLDPEQFRALPSLSKRAVALSHAGLDFTSIDRQIAEAEEERTLSGRALKALGALPPEPADVDPVSVADLVAEQTRRYEFNRAQTAIASENVATVGKVRDRIIQAIRDRAFADYDELGNLLALVVDEFKAGAKAAPLVPLADFLPTDDISAQLANAEATNAAARVYADWEALAAKIEAAKADYEARGAEVNRLRETKHAMSSATTLPMKGLEITDTGLSFNGISDENWSDSESLKIALTLALAYSGELRAVYIKRGEALDSASIEKLRAFAEKHDAQIIMEIVDDSYSHEGGNVILIEDGSIRIASK
jgi:hypothetical protein